MSILPNPPRVLLLDAMGVMYTHADDVRDLLKPYVESLREPVELPFLKKIYTEASVGMYGAEEVWRQLGLSPKCEEDYLDSYTLMDGLMSFLPKAMKRVDHILCLSNDIASWATKRRTRFHMDAYFSGWYISSDLKARKPEQAIYERFLAQSGLPAADILFVDDRQVNLLAARAAGMHVVAFRSIDDPKDPSIPQVAAFSELLEYLA